MSVIHPPLAQLTRILARPEGDAERAHVAQCERCQASLHALQEFLALDPAAAANAVELAAVNARLAEMVPQVVGPSAQPASPASSPASSPGKLLQLPAAASSKRTRLPGILAIAASLMLVSTVVLMRRADSPAQFRGEADNSFVAGLTLTGSPGGLTLRWDAFAGASRYRVQVFDSKVHVVADYGPLAAAGVTLPADSLAALAARIPAAEHLTWQVLALSGRDEIARSPWRRFPLAGH